MSGVAEGWVSVLGNGFAAPRGPRPPLAPLSCYHPSWPLPELLPSPSLQSSAQLLPPTTSLLCPALSTTPKPQGHQARPPAFLPCFHLGDVPQNTQPAGGGCSLGAPGKALESLGLAVASSVAKAAAGGRVFLG